MKKLVIISVSIVIIILVLVVGFLKITMPYIFPKIYYIKKEKIESPKIRFYYGGAPNQKEEEQEGGEFIEINFEDNELLKKILTVLEGKMHIYMPDNNIIYDNDYKIYKVMLADNLYFNFDPSSKGLIYISYKNKHFTKVIDEKLLDKIRNIATKAFFEDTNMFETEKIEIYNYKEDYALAKEITDPEKISNICNLLKNVNMEKNGTVHNDREVVRQRINFDKPFYEVHFTPHIALYISNDFEKTYTIKYAYQYTGMNETAFLLEVTNLDKKLVELLSIDEGENYQIIESRLETGETIGVEEDSLSNEGIRLTIFNKSYECYKDNDFIIYKEVDGNWEELEAYAEQDRTIVTKSSSVNIERINWQEKYGQLESGKYKLERTIFIQGRYDEVNRETKYFVIFEIKP